MPDPVPAFSPGEGDTLQEPVAQPARKAASSRNKARRKKASKPASQKPAKRTARAASAARVKVGSDTIGLPGGLAEHLTAKDLKRLRAIFKRARKRAKKQAAKKKSQ